MELPKARTENIVIQNLKNEILIYDLSNNKAFCLNDTSAKVFNACDGRTTFAELEAKSELTDEIIRLALDGLKKENLIEAGYVSSFTGLSRREVIRRVGLASVIALPVISALVAPTASMAAASGATCNSCTNTFFTATGLPITVDQNTGGVTSTGCVAGCVNCRCTIPGGLNSCTSTCSVA